MQMSQLLWDRNKDKSNYFCPIIIVTFSVWDLYANVQLLWDRNKDKSNFFCPMIIVTFIYEIYMQMSNYYATEIRINQTTSAIIVGGILML